MMGVSKCAAKMGSAGRNAAAIGIGPHGGQSVQRVHEGLAFRNRWKPGGNRNRIAPKRLAVDSRSWWRVRWKPSKNRLTTIRSAPQNIELPKILTPEAESPEPSAPISSTPCGVAPRGSVASVRRTARASCVGEHVRVRALPAQDPSTPLSCHPVHLRHFGGCRSRRVTARRGWSPPPMPRRQANQLIRGHDRALPAMLIMRGLKTGSRRRSGQIATPMASNSPWPQRGGGQKSGANRIAPAQP